MSLSQPPASTTDCGPLNDEFETDRGWNFDPNATDTATSGQLERATPQKTRTKQGVKQRRYGYSGLAALVTGAASGGSVGCQ